MGGTRAARASHLLGTNAWKAIGYSRRAVMSARRTGGNASLSEFLTALVSAPPAQGALSAAAAASAMGTSLLLNVALLPTTRSESADERTALAAEAVILGDIRAKLVVVATQTAVKAFPRKLPQTGQTERLTRDAAIQLVLRAAADAPLEVIRLSAAGLKRARTVAAYSCRAARSDVELAIALLRVGLSGARANLEGKLSSLTDAEYTRAVVEEVAHLGEEALTAATDAESSVQPPPA
jgi:methenyltetrahydrofolate cyclohydrolase